MLNVTVTEPGSGGFVTVFPCGSSRPNASHLNFVAGQTVPNAVIAKPDSAGRVCLYTHADTHLIVDLNGFYLDSAGYAGTVPARVWSRGPGTRLSMASSPGSAVAPLDQ